MNYWAQTKPKHKANSGQLLNKRKCRRKYLLSGNADLAPKRSAILDTCENIAESPDPLCAFWDWTDIHIDLLLTDEINLSRISYRPLKRT